MGKPDDNGTSELVGSKNHMHTTTTIKTALQSGSAKKVTPLVLAHTVLCRSGGKGGSFQLWAAGCSYLQVSIQTKCNSPSKLDPEEPKKYW